MDILKNPIVLAIIAGILTYFLLYWWNQRKDPQDQSKSSNILIPAIVAAVVWLFSSFYFLNSNKNVENNVSPVNLKIEETPLKKINISNVSDNGTHSFDKGYNLKAKNVLELPQTDVFIDLAKF